MMNPKEADEYVHEYVEGAEHGKVNDMADLIKKAILDGEDNLVVSWLNFQTMMLTEAGAPVHVMRAGTRETMRVINALRTAEPGQKLKDTAYGQDMLRQLNLVQRRVRPIMA
jgi:hypothetical protein